MPPDEGQGVVPDDTDTTKSADDSNDITDDSKITPSEQSAALNSVGDISGPDALTITSSTRNSLTPEIDNTTGSLIYKYPIQVSPGRNDMTPDVNLVYNSANSTNDSVIGSGWSIDIPYIERVNKIGTNALYSSNYYSSSLSGELTALNSTDYVAKVEKGDFLRYTKLTNGWLVVDKNGTKYTFGANAQARQDNSADTTQVFKWMLEEIRDTNDNYISYTYYKDAGQIYPSQIIYTGHASTAGVLEVNFDRTSRANAVPNYSTGFLVQSNYRITEIRTEINNVWVRKYTLAYTTGDNGAGSLLNTITESGQDDSSTITTLPAVDFDYQSAVRNWTYTPSWNHIPLPFGSGTGDSGARMADINGDGLLDVLCHNSSSSSNYCSDSNPKVFLNNGDGTWTNVSSTWLFPLEGGTGTNRESFLTTSGGNDKGLRAIDINGDGLTDLIKAYGNTSYVYLNNGSGWTYNSTWSTNWGSMVDIPFISSSNVDSGLRIADINGDGLLDVLCHNTSINGICDKTSPFIALNNGDGTWTNVSSTWLFPLEGGAGTDREGFLNTSGGNDRGLRATDVNGDGLADLTKGNASYVYLNNGSGWTYTPSWNHIPLPFGNPTSDAGTRIADINGDNLYDLICHTNMTTGTCSKLNPRIFTNDGDGTWTEVDGTWLFPLEGGAGSNREYFISSSGADSGLRSMDINGDGLPDLAEGNSGNVYLNDTTIQSDLLKKITYAQGGNTTVTYKATPLFRNGSNLLNPSLPMILDVVSQITIDDGAGTSENYTYEYEGGLYYYNTVLDRKFAGFNSIKVTDAAGNIKKTYYYQGNSTNTTLGEYNDHVAKIGMPYRIEEYDNSSNLYRLTVDKVDRYNIGTDHDFVKIIRRTELNYDGNSGHKDVSTEYGYDDANGNVLTKTEWGEVTGSADGSFADTGSDKRITTYTYATNGTTKVNVPYGEVVTDASSAKVKENRYYYDGLALGSVSTGNQTKVEQWKTSTTYINTQRAYNSYGLPISDTDARGKVTTYTTYDTYNLYPITVTDPLSHTMQYLYDYSLGKPKQTTDQNGFIYQTTYDGLDRPTIVKIPDFTSPYSAVTKTAYVYTDTAGAVKVQRTNYLDASTTADVYQYFDGLGRLIQERKEAEASGNFNAKDTVYNNVGLAYKQSLPYTSSGSSKTSATGTTALYATNTYDPLQRISSVADATGTTSYAYDDWKTTVTDKNGKVKKYYKDAYDNLIKVDEINGGSTYTTNYEWNLNNKLTKITDALSNIRNFTYDGLGRRLTAQDLHASADGTYGTWTYTYDDAGNLTQSVSPRSLTTNYTYNDVNQQLTEDYTGAAGTEITYVYSGCTNGTGKPCSVTMTLGANTSYTYDSNGNIASEVKTINSTGYTTSYTYDRQGNKLVITYPDSAQVKYTFNTAGFLEKIERKESGGSFTDVVSNYNYGPTDQVTTQTDTNGITTLNTYDASHLYRLTTRTSANTASPTPPNNQRPVITLTGADLVKLYVGDVWSELGYSATDTEDGTLTSSVAVTGTVNTAVAGTYQLVYDVADSYGVPAAKKIRTVVVRPVVYGTVKALIIGGGGGGGKGSTKQGGGGGAGGYIENNSVSIIAQAYAVTVGNGGPGAASTGTNGVNGSDSSALSLVATGGGGGASGSEVLGSNGGSGGGGAGGCCSSDPGGTGISGQGHDGGKGYTTSTGSSNRAGGGGGGAGAVGSAGSSNSHGGNGGAGAASSITGTSITRAGGGGGNGSTAGTASAGGGAGGGTSTNGVSGTANTGGGGGGADSSHSGGAGGSGVVIIAYHTDGSDGISPSSTGGTVTTAGAYTVHTFNSSATFTALATSNTNPVISLTGFDVYTLTIGATWTEPGYSATDTQDGSLTGSVTTTGTVNTAAPGTYQIVYAVVDSQGAPAARKIRTVVVGSGVTNLQNLTYSYDNVGNITQIIDTSNTSSAKTANYVYDDLNRMTSATITAVASGQSTYTHTFTYDAIGNISTGPIGSYTYAGTGYANPHAATTINGATYAYDNDGNLTGNGTLSNTWNYKDQITQAVKSGVTSTYTYDQNGERATLANGTTTTVYPNDYYNVDSAGKKTKQIYAGSQLVATIETSGTGGTTTTYQIYGDSTTWEDWSWDYTINFNETGTVYSGTKSIKMIYTAPWGGLYLANSPTGVSTAGATHVQFAVRAASAGANLEAEAYGPGDASLGSAVQLTNYIPGGVMAANTWYVISIPLADLGAVGATLTGFEVLSELTGTFYFDDIKLVNIATGGTVTPYYNHTDQLGSVTAVSDGSGALAETLDYFPYGNQRISSGAHTEKRQYVGQIYDTDTGLDYLNARYYDGKIGRFVSEDPQFWNFDNAWLTDPQNQNSYSYGRDNPITMSDPKGLSAAGAPIGPWEILFMMAFSPTVTSYDPVYESDQYQAQNDPNTKLMGTMMGLMTPGGGEVNVAGGVARETGMLKALTPDLQSELKNVKKVDTAYSRPAGATTQVMKNSVNYPGVSCSNCGRTGVPMVADHKTPLVVEYYRTGKIDTQQMRSPASVQPQCASCSAKQGGLLSAFSQAVKKALGLK
ncbi:MAG: immunoglobulin-like domain-containing protein [bacterium]